jgi:radical SAM superfamily enzyme YgiQ (UPF0313 family)
MALLGIHYKCHTRSDLINDSKAQLMQFSGCEECGLGVESADNDVLKLNNKKENADDHLKAIDIIRRAGMRVKTYFVMGLPGETDKTLELNKEFACKAKVDKWTISTFMPYPGCPIFKTPGLFKIEILNHDFSKWWNYAEGSYNHIIYGQTPERMWERYKEFYSFMKEGKYAN